MEHLLADDVVARLTADAADGAFVLSGKESAGLEASVLATVTGLVTGAAFVTPSEPMDQVRWAAREGMAHDNLLRAIWRAHAHIQETLVDALVTAVPADRLGVEVRRISAGLLDAVTTLTRDASAVFDAESAAWGRFRSAAIRRVLDDLVDSGEIRTDAGEVLGIRLGDHHLAAVLWQVGDDIDPSWRPDQAHWVAQVAERLGARTSVVIPRTDGTTEVVWSAASHPDDSAVADLESMGLPTGTAVAVGVVAVAGVGLRTSLGAARRVAAAGRGPAVPGVWTYRHHGAAALMLVDPDGARDFVRFCLAGILGDDERTASLRTTLLTFLRHQGSRTRAAQHLHIAPTTVAYRVRQARERLARDDVDTDVLIAALTVATIRPDLAA